MTERLLRWIQSPARPALSLSAVSLCVIWLFASALPCRADFISYYQTQPGAVNPDDGKPVNAGVTFAAEGSTLTITLTNLQADPKAVSQNLSDLFFTFTTGETTGVLTSSAADFITVDENHDFAAAGSGGTGWILRQGFAGGLKLDLLGTGTAPMHSIIGPPDSGGKYDAAKGSIAGNKPHNPFIDQTATFVLNVPISEETRIKEVIFSFGTAPGQEVTGSQPVPEPATLLLLGTGLGLLGIRLYRRRI